MKEENKVVIIIINASSGIRTHGLSREKVWSCASYHDSGRDGYTPAAVGVGHDIAKPNAKECNGNEPHGV